MSGPLPFPGMGTISAQPGFRPVKRRDLMSAVNTVGRDLGLRPASIVVLDALLSCLPCKSAATGAENEITPATLLTVFASNETLCYRAKGITDRQLRRHLERLEAVGLIRRRDSANGKRFPIYRAGKVVGAFGLDLAPLLLRAEDLMALARKRRSEAAEMRGLKAHIQTLRAQCLRRDLDDAEVNFVESVRNLMRRVGATILEARRIVGKLTQILMDSRTDPCSEEVAAGNLRPDRVSGTTRIEIETCETPANDGQNVRHKESQKPYTKKSGAFSRSNVWQALVTVPDFYPDPPTCEHGIRRVLYEFGAMLGISHNSVTSAIREIGAVGTLQLQDRIAQWIATIADPDKYLAKAVESLKVRKVGHGQLQKYA